MSRQAVGPEMHEIRLKRFSETPNAGDLASAPVVEYVSARKVEIIGESPAGTPNLIAIGSILHWADENSTIWGTGLLSEDIRLGAKPKSILAVRGRRTRDRLQKQGITCPPVFGDPGVFLPGIYPKQPLRWDLGIVPHYVDQDEPFILEAAAGGAKIIDVTKPIHQYAAELSSCARILTSSLHGLVFAHAYGIPGAWIRLSDRVLGDGFKFYDYYSSVGMQSSDVPMLTPGHDLEALVRSCHMPPDPIDQNALRVALLEGLPA